MKTNKLLSLVLAFVICFAAPLTVNPLKAFAEDATTPVAKVGNTEYATIDEAIANWTNGATLTLLADVTLSGTIQLSSTEMHTLDLGVYTMTAAKSKDAIQIVNNGRSSASYALDIKADANNPGGITATSKAVVKTTGKSGVKDRPIIRFYNGVFNASNVISHSGSNGTNCPQFQFHGGEFNGSLSANRALIQIYGGTFNGKFWTSVDSSAYMLIAGGKFKELSNLYGSALTSDKFTIGSSKGNYNRYVYVGADGYYNVVSTPIAENTDLEASLIATYNSSNYFAYSTANNSAYGMGYTSLEAAIKDAGSSKKVRALKTSSEPLDITSAVNFDMTNGGVEPANVITLASATAKLTITFAEGDEPNMVVNGCSELYELTYSDSVVDGIVTRTYSQTKIPGEANIGSTEYLTFEAALAEVTEGQTITLNKDVSASNLTIDKSITLNLNGKTLTLGSAMARALTADLTHTADITIKNGTVKAAGEEKALIESLAVLTLDGVKLENVTLDVANDENATLLTLKGSTEIEESEIIASEDSVACNVEGEVTVSNSAVQGLIKLTSGKLTTSSATQAEVTYEVPGKYVQIEEATAEEIVRLDDYKFDISVDKNALKTGETLTATISLDKDFYSTEFTFTYNKDLFECSADSDGDGVIYMILFSKEGANYQSLATFELVAKNTINNVTSTELEVKGNVIQYKEQAINQYVNLAEGDKEEIKISLNYEVKIYADYVSGYSLVLVDGADGGYAYNGTAMFYMKDYDAYAFIVEGGVNPADVDAAISKASGCKEIKISYDVNCEFVADGKVDLKDATIAYACTSLDFDVAQYMELYLRANVINDEEGKIQVNSADINAIIAYYNSL